MSNTKRSVWYFGTLLAVTLYGSIFFTAASHSSFFKPAPSLNLDLSKVEPIEVAPIIKTEQLDNVKDSGKLVLGLLQTPASYFERQHDAIGFDYQMANELANHLGVTLEVKLFETPKELLSAFQQHQVDLVASELNAEDIQSKSIPYYDLDLVVVQRRNAVSVNSKKQLADLEGVKITLANQKPSGFDDLNLKVTNSATPEALLHAVNNEKYDYALVSRHHYQTLAPLFPELKQSMSYKKQQLQWHLAEQPNVSNASLVKEISTFMDSEAAKQHAKQLADIYFTPKKRFDLYSSRAFKKHWESRLKLYADDFQMAAKDHDFDWHLLAAIGYQESHWDANAVSPTGVEGIMMLTLPTARETGVHNRKDPTASIHGGASYLASIHKRMPQDIHEPDRTWMALAAYNIGYGHLLDARRLTVQQGGNPNVWTDVADRLPLLAKPQFYQQTRHGYAAGSAQVVMYVEAVQQYYHTLIWANASWNENTEMLAMNL